MENTFRLAEQAKEVKDWNKSYFQFVAYSTRANASKGDNLTHSFCDRVQNADWSDKEFTCYARGIIEGLRAKYKDPVVELWLHIDNGSGMNNNILLRHWNA